MSEESPNKQLDTAIKDLLKDAKEQPFDMRCKAMNTAIAWQKCKYAIMSKEDDFDPDEI
jgi:uncharacterized protein (UPF0335 family)